MSLITLADVSLAYGLHALLDHSRFALEKGERVCLIGRNGAGKSTLLRLLAGQIVPDEGHVRAEPALRIALLEQELPTPSDATIYDTVASGLGALGALLAEHHRISQHADSEAALQMLAELQHRIEREDGWNFESKVDAALTRLSLPADLAVADCSGGMRRRVMLARALVADPDVLLLDEPTNHLDIAAIAALESLLLDFRGAIVFVTHDRALLRRLATRIIELDRGQLVDFPGDYDTYVRRKAAMLEAEASENRKFDKALAEEEVWIRQGIKARRTRNEGRARRLVAMREERRQRIARHGTVRLELDDATRSGRLVAELHHVRFGYGDTPIVRDLTLTVNRGDRIGIIGPNGCGKSTLLRLILGELEPQAGSIRRGTRLEVAYFDQARAQLDPEKSVRDNVSEGSDQVTIGGRTRHVMSYLADFLFTPARARSPVASLSGGERNRLLLARLFTRPANLLVMDEPTNDLDIETLELLEELLAEYAGTLLLVSHDRDFLDNVVTSTLVFEGDGRWREHVGGYQDWLREAGSPRGGAPKAAAPKTATPGGSEAPHKAVARPRLSYKEQRELEGLPQTIERIEAEQLALQTEINGAGFYRQDQETIRSRLATLSEVNRRLTEAYDRWQSLEERQH